MTEVQQKPALAGLVGTILIWILIFLFFYFSALFFAPKPYKTIKIRLDAPSTSAGESVAKPAPATPPKASAQQNKPAASKPSPSKAATAKPAPTKTVEQPKMAEQTLQKSMEELMAEQQAKKTTKKEFDWSQFDDIEGNSSSNSSSAALAKNTASNASSQNAFSGSAASSSNSQSTAASATSSNARSSANQSASSATSSALAGAVSAKRYSSNSGGVSSTVSANTGSSSDGKVSLQMSDGTSRALLEPTEPKILLSPEASALIDSTKRLTVTFTVMASGNVQVTSIKISPDILPSLVSMEIREQISRWRFQAASYDGTARFDYTIQKN
ncbi:hypothetical protein [Treponema sp. UBA3813]|uniref:hypothetical protein n=1 Tax=Treponema sp. UBA3813 TaxID=1947715 RepID=UPI0025E807FB|nr:hypothetical protein [Treponema sp. UBA3813]